MKKTSLKEAVVAVTYRCNSKCRMCNIWKIREHQNEIAADDFLNLPATLKDINITGGEPFLRPDLALILAKIKKRCPAARVIISSNGFATELIAKQMKEIIKIMPEIGVAISIDGIAQSHNEIRGVADGFAKTLVTIGKLKDLGVKHLKIGFTIGEYNAGELFEIYQLAEKLEVELSLTVVHSSENYFGKDNSIKDKQAIVESLNWLIEKELRSGNYKKWARAYFAYGAREFVKTGKRILPDYSGKLSIFVNPQGKVYPCDVSNQIMGDIRDFDNLIMQDSTKDCGASWMVCTARQSIKKHFIQVIWWILKHKFLGIKI